MTSFNVDLNLKPREYILDPNYLGQRFDLFEKVCFPSVFRQSCQNFRWLVFLDQETPKPFKQKINALRQQYKNILIPIYTPPNINGNIWGKTIQNYLSKNCQFVITSNLDNDDAIGKDFIKIVQENFHEQEFEFLNFPFGYLLRKDGLFLREFLSSPFLSLIEKKDNLLTCKSIPHQKLYQLFQKGVPVRQIIIPPIWLQIVHESNVINNFDVNSVVQPLNRLEEQFSLTDSFAQNYQFNYQDSLSYYLSKSIKSNHIIISRKIRNIITLLIPSTPLIYLKWSGAVKKILIKSKLRLCSSKAKTLCEQLVEF